MLANPAKAGRDLKKAWNPGLDRCSKGPVPSCTCNMLTVYCVADVSMQNKSRDGKGSKGAGVCVRASGRLTVPELGGDGVSQILWF